MYNRSIANAENINQITAILNNNQIQEIAIDYKLARLFHQCQKQSSKEKFQQALSKNTSLRKLNIITIDMVLIKACLNLSTLNSMVVDYIDHIDHFNLICQILKSNSELQTIILKHIGKECFREEEFVSVMACLSNLRHLGLFIESIATQSLLFLAALRIPELQLIFESQIKEEQIKSILNIVMQNKFISELSINLFICYGSDSVSSLFNSFQAIPNLYRLALGGYRRSSDLLSCSLQLLNRSNSLLDFHISLDEENNKQAMHSDFQAALKLNALQQHDVLWLAILLAQVYRASQAGAQAVGMHALPPELLWLIFQFACEVVPSPLPHFSKDELFNACIINKLPTLSKPLPARYNGMVLPRGKDQPMFFKSISPKERYVHQNKKALQLIHDYCHRLKLSDKNHHKEKKIAALEGLSCRLKNTTSIYQTIKDWLGDNHHIIQTQHNAVDKFFQELFLAEYRLTKTSQLIKQILELDPAYSVAHADAIDGMLDRSRQIK